MKLSALADFHRIAAAGSLGRASRESGRPKATLSRQIRQLEESLGLRLVERGPGGLQLTREGQALYEETRAPLRDIEDTGRRLASGQAQLRGLLRVSAPVLFSEIAGARLATDFVQRFPGVQLEWVTSDRPLDLVDEGIDVVIRVNPAPASELVGRCFARDAMLLVAAPSVAAGTGSDIEGHPPDAVPAVVMSGGPSALEPSVWQVDVNGSSKRIIPDYKLRLSSFSMIAAAVRAGAGAALLPRSLVRADVASGALVVWGAYPERSVELWVLHRSRRLASRKVSAFVDFVYESFPDGEL